LVRHSLLIHKLNRNLVLGVKCPLLGVMLFDAAGDISSNPGIKRFIPAVYYIEEPGHGIKGKIDYGKILCTCCAPSGLASAKFPIEKI